MISNLYTTTSLSVTREFMLREFLIVTGSAIYVDFMDRYEVVETRFYDKLEMSGCFVADIKFFRLYWTLDEVDFYNVKIVDIV